METINFYEPPKGGRISSPKFRASLLKSAEFAGLKEDVSRFHALKLVKQAGKEIGFGPELVELLEYYVMKTRDIDWSEGHWPICYQTVIATAQALGISERQVRNREKALHMLGALTWNDTGNFKRFGMREKVTGAIKFAHGVDLSPLASLIPILEQKIEQKKILHALWEDEKRAISALRARIRSLLAEAACYDDFQDLSQTLETEYKAISYSLRTYHDLNHLKTLRAQHQLLVDGLLSALEVVCKAEDDVLLSSNNTPMVATDFPHIQSTTLKQSDKSDYSSRFDNSFQGRVAAFSVTNKEDREGGKIWRNEKVSEIELQNGNITTKQVLNAASERFRTHIPFSSRQMGWDDLVEAAYSLLPELKINKSAWGDACVGMGRSFAAVCVMIIDQKMQQPDTQIRNPGGYLRAMTKRAKSGELNLHGSVFGLLKKDGLHDA